VAHWLVVDFGYEAAVWFILPTLLYVASGVSPSGLFHRFFHVVYVGLFPNSDGDHPSSHLVLKFSVSEKNGATSSPL
jgi:hypothetical protein